MSQQASAALGTWLPLLGTVLAYEVGLRLQRHCAGKAIANPVLIAVILLTVVIRTTGATALAFTEGVRPLGWLLGPITVALALPIYRNAARIRQAFIPIIVSVGVGAAIAASTAVLIAAALGGTELLLRSIASKSATAAVSLAIAAQIGGDPALAAGISVLTGITGAVMCCGILDYIGVHDPRARGLATGTTAHAIGTSRMLAFNNEAGAFSSTAMGLAALMAGTLIPVVAWLLD